MSESYRVSVSISEELDCVTSHSFPVVRGEDVSIHDESGKQRVSFAIVDCLRMLLRGEDCETARVLAYAVDVLRSFVDVNDQEGAEVVRILRSAIDRFPSSSAGDSTD